MDKPSRGPELIGITLFLTIFGAVFVLARLYTRVFVSRTAGWDDFFMGGALVGELVADSFNILMQLPGSKRDLARIDYSLRQVWLRTDNCDTNSSVEAYPCCQIHSVLDFREWSRHGHDEGRNRHYVAKDPAQQAVQHLRHDPDRCQCVGQFHRLL
jgi:hypothetical protein